MPTLIVVPLYEFACLGCGQRFERLRTALDAPPACPSCGSSEVTRLISLIAGLTGSGSTGPTTRCGCGGRCACSN
jgi:putative FmdB family regulatory protein